LTTAIHAIREELNRIADLLIEAEETGKFLVNAEYDNANVPFVRWTNAGSARKKQLVANVSYMKSSGLRAKHYQNTEIYERRTELE
jgi:hypothetical protein